MTITITKLTENGKNLGQEKETIQVRNLIAFKDGQFHDLACVRWYMSRSKQANRVYCTIWVTTKVFGTYCAGHSWTSGYGFCKQSDAFELAINTAGIYSSEPISGRGMSTVEDFLMEMGKHAGFNDCYVSKG